MLSNPDEQIREENKQGSQSLKRSLNQLQYQCIKNQFKKGGLSQEFQHQVKGMEVSMILCEKSMRLLAEDFVQQLTLFQNASSPMEALAALNAAEELWEKEAGSIRRLDSSGQERAFLNKMRRQMLLTLENKLLDLPHSVPHNKIHEMAALSLGLLGIMDKILGELGVSVHSPERTRLAQIAKGFA